MHSAVMKPSGNLRGAAFMAGAACVTALIDRLTHHAEIFSLEGRSYRLKEAEERKTRRAPRNP